jgi:hypothetical protein
MTYLQASHADLEREAELRRSQAARLVAVERARDAHLPATQARTGQAASTAQAGT